MAASAETVQGFEFDTVVGLDDDTTESGGRLALNRQGIIGIGLMLVGLLALLITWMQIKDINNIAAQIPYVASGGLLGVALAVIGSVAFFTGTKTANRTRSRAIALVGAIRPVRGPGLQIDECLRLAAVPSRGGLPANSPEA